MGLSVDKVGGFLTSLVQKGDPQAAMAAGTGPVTTEWAAAHGYTQWRLPSEAVTREVLKAVPAGISLYGTYAKEKQAKKRIKKIKKETRKKTKEVEGARKKDRLLRRPSRERGIL